MLTQHLTYAGYGPSTPYLAGVAKNERVSAAEHFQDVRHIELDLGRSGLSYKPGDILGVLPRQSDEAVEQLLCLLGLEKVQWIRVEAVIGEGLTGSAPAIEVQAPPSYSCAGCSWVIR
jgi:sulfite reductase alpha subunit-like flavoprotein